MTSYKLPAAVKVGWLQALRSGEYLQVQAELHRSLDAICSVERHCCLGVLADQFGVLDACSGYFRAKGTDGEWFVVPADVQLKLASLNDEGKTFLQIADYIEKHL